MGVLKIFSDASAGEQESNNVGLSWLYYMQGEDNFTVASSLKSLHGGTSPINFAEGLAALESAQHLGLYLKSRGIEHVSELHHHIDNQRAYFSLQASFAKRSKKPHDSKFITPMSKKYAHTISHLGIQPKPKLQAIRTPRKKGLIPIADRFAGHARKTGEVLEAPVTLPTSCLRQLLRTHNPVAFANDHAIHLDS